MEVVLVIQPFRNCWCYEHSIHSWQYALKQESLFDAGSCTQPFIFSGLIKLLLLSQIFIQSPIIYGDHGTQYYPGVKSNAKMAQKKNQERKREKEKQERIVKQHQVMPKGTY